MNSAETVCESCEMLREENRLLRSKLETLTNPSISPHWLAWSFGLATALSLVVFPIFASGAFLDYEGWQSALYGCSMSGPWTQFSILTCFCVLLGSSLWKRVLIYIVVVFVLYQGWGFAERFGDGEIEPLVYSGPFAAALITSPVLLMRSLRRWQILHHSDLREPAPTSIASYFVLTLFCGGWVSLLSWLPESATDSWLEEDHAYLKFTSSLLVGGMIIGLIVPRFLLAAQTNWRTLCGWLPIAWAISLLGPLFWAMEDGSGEELLYASLGFAWQVSFTIWFVLATLAFRVFGYRLQASS